MTGRGWVELDADRGLRIPVANVLGQLAAGRTVDQILTDFPDLEAEDIQLRWSTPPQPFRNVSFH